jgi:flagellum-specific peptidoglycan hydrolase FlgJ
MMAKEEFVRRAYAAASQSSEQSGMPVMVTVAQAALESDWGQSRLSREANNFFGIKAHGRHERIQMSTEEFEHGDRVVIQAEFAKYLSMADCIRCRDGILLRGAVYAAARQVRGDEEGFIREMAKHWATDPRYAEKLQAVLAEVKGLLQDGAPECTVGAKAQ